MMHFAFAHRYIVIVLIVVFCAHVGSYAYLARLAAGNPNAAQYPLLKGDSERYAELADSLIVTGSFVGSEFETERHWPPGYPWFLAGVKFVTGSFVPAIALQVAFALMAVALIYTMALRYLPPLWAAVPALVYGLDPNVILANTTILSDSLFSSLLVLAVYLGLFARMKSEAVRWGAVGALLGVLALIRPIAQLLPPVAFVLLFIQLYRAYRSEVRSYVLPVVSYVLAVCIVVGPWLSWMHEKFGVYEISHVSASNLLWYNAEDFLAWKEMNKERSVPAILASRYQSDPAYERVHAALLEELNAMTPPGGNVQNYEGSLALRVILRDPVSYAYFHLINTAPFFLGSSIAAYGQTVMQVGDSTGYYAPTALALIESARAALSGEFSGLVRTIPIALEILLWALICALALIGLWKGRYDICILAFAALVAYFSLLTGPVSIVRYRIPAEPYLLLLAVLGARVIYERITERA